MTYVANFAYRPGDRVYLKALHLPAMITGCMAVDDGKQYRVVWWSDGARKCEWLHEFELVSPPT